MIFSTIVDNTLKKQESYGLSMTDVNFFTIVLYVIFSLCVFIDATKIGFPKTNQFTSKFNSHVLWFLEVIYDFKAATLIFK